MTTWRATRPYRNVASEARCWPGLGHGTIGLKLGKFPWEFPHGFSQINHTNNPFLVNFLILIPTSDVAKVLRLQSLFKDVLFKVGIKLEWLMFGHGPRPKQHRLLDSDSAHDPLDLLYWVLFKVIFYFPNRKSTIWGIYSEDFLFFGNPLSKSKYRMAMFWCFDPRGPPVFLRPVTCGTLWMCPVTRNDWRWQKRCMSWPNRWYRWRHDIYIYIHIKYKLYIHIIYIHDIYIYIIYKPYIYIYIYICTYII